MSKGDAANRHLVPRDDCLYARGSYIGVDDKGKVAVGFGIAACGAVLISVPGQRGMQRVQVHFEQRGSIVVYVKALQRRAAHFADCADGSAVAEQSRRSARLQDGVGGVCLIRY